MTSRRQNVASTLLGRKRRGPSKQRAHALCMLAIALDCSSRRVCGCVGASDRGLAMDRETVPTLAAARVESRREREREREGADELMK